VSTAPQISVLLPVHNGARFVGAAIDSVLAQSFGDFELLVVDDGSTDDTREIVRGCPDARVRLHVNERRTGVASALNRGLPLARGRYLARMDADDCCDPDRFSTQVQYLQDNPRTFLVGSGYRLAGNGREVRLPHDDAQIRFHLSRFNCISHPTVMFRLDEFRRHGLGFDPAFRHAEDYACWVRCSRLGLKLANVPRPLVTYRRHRQQASSVHRAEQARTARSIIVEQLAHIGLRPDPRQERLHFSILQRDYGADEDYLDRAGRWIAALLEANRAAGYYDEALMESFYAERWFRIAYQATGLGPRLLRRWRGAAFSRGFRPEPVEALKLAARALLGVGTGERAAQGQRG